MQDPLSFNNLIEDEHSESERELLHWELKKVQHGLSANCKIKYSY